ncbi:phage tail tape measure protein [Cupriavidus malaysiensis]|uniref:Phage tail tape measure protein n=1 Tax=Cupriavidus malaysiensis TaxID=367825 RepID=A0ABM6F5J3_9BURK|nr:phage tail tape measure protein [Cupriavidus malaysiensis]AOZ06765.1 phage tail tape measure protein [Cupriavidus malaysiensis]
MDDETVVRVTADADGYISALERARKSAADFVTGQDAIRQRLTNSVSAIEAARQAVKAQGDEALAAFNKSSKTAERWLTQLQRQAAEAGKTREELMRLRAAELGVSDAADKYIAQIEAANNSHRKLQEGVGMSAAAMNAAMRSVPAQMTDVVTQLAGGQSPLLILTQQGGQLKDMFGGVVPAIKATATYIASLITPTTIAAAGMAALGYAWYAGTKEAKEFNAALQLTSNYAGLTASSFQAMTQRVAADARTSFGSAREALLGFAKGGELTGSQMESLADLVVRTSRISGEALAEVSKDYAKLAQDPAKWAVEHNQSMHFMDVATYQHIQALQEAGDKHGAIQAVIDAATAQVANSTVEHLSKAERAWRDLSSGLQQFWAELKKGFGSGPTMQDRIDTLLGERKDIQGYGLAAGRVAEIDRQVALLQEQQRMEQRAAESQAKAAQVQQAAVEAEVRVDKLRDQVMSNAQRRQKELEKLNRDRAAILAGGGAFSDADYRKLVADINDKYKDPKTAKPKAFQDDAATKFIEQIRQQDAAVQAALASTSKLTEAEKKQAEFVQLIADLKGKSVLTADQRSLLAAQDKVKAALDQYVADSKALKVKEDLVKLEERSAQINEHIASYRQSQQDQYQRQLDAIGLGSQAQQQVEATKAIYREFRRQQEQLTKATPESQIGGAQYLAETAAIQAQLEASLKDYEAYYASLKAKQADWTNGATQAMANYRDYAANVADQTSRAFANAFQGLEDAVVNFAMNGKLSFSDFAKSVIADLVRIQARAAISGLAQMGINVVGGMFGSAETWNGGVQGVTGEFTGSQATGVFYKAGGGLISGPGTGTSDSIPAMLSNGEFVVNSAATAQHRNLLEAINGGAWPARFASGGFVGEADAGLWSGTADSGATLSNAFEPRASGDGGGDVYITQHINVDSRADQASIIQAMHVAKEAAVREIQADLRRGGQTAKLAGRV